MVENNSEEIKKALAGSTPTNETEGKEKKVEKNKVEEMPFIQVNEEILGGLRAAMLRGENLKDAMMSFYRAGYNKKEIEDAARDYISEKEKQPIVAPITSPIKTKSPTGSKDPKQITPQKVSQYGKKRGFKFDKTTLFLIGTLLLLLLVLAGVLLFKEQIVDFFNNTFG